MALYTKFICLIHIAIWHYNVMFGCRPGLQVPIGIKIAAQRPNLIIKFENVVSIKLIGARSYAFV